MRILLCTKIIVVLSAPFKIIQCTMFLIVHHLGHSNIRWYGFETSHWWSQLSCVIGNFFFSWNWNPIFELKKNLKPPFLVYRVANWANATLRLMMMSSCCSRSPFAGSRACRPSKTQFFTKIYRLRFLIKIKLLGQFN